MHASTRGQQESSLDAVDGWPNGSVGRALAPEIFLSSSAILTGAMALAVSCLLILTAWSAPVAATDDRSWSPGESKPVQALLTAAANARNGLVLASQRRVPHERPIWDWPLAGQPPVVHPFDAPAQRWLPGHRGIDLGGLTGEPVLTVADGVVAYSGVIAGVGVVSVQHPDGLRSTYQPVQDRLGRGVQVRSGQALGTLDGASHCLVRTCLHLGAKRGDAYLDPLLLLRAWEVSLLPRD